MNRECGRDTRVGIKENTLYNWLSVCRHAKPYKRCERWTFIRWAETIKERSCAFDGERDLLKKRQRTFARETREVRMDFWKQSVDYSVGIIVFGLSVSRSAYYAWTKAIEITKPSAIGTENSDYRRIYPKPRSLMERAASRTFGETRR